MENVTALKPENLKATKKIIDKTIKKAYLNKIIQVTITEENDWEGETFSYILYIPRKTAFKIEEAFKSDYEVTIDYPTKYTEAKVKNINKMSKNTYMDRIGFYKLDKLPKGKFDWYEDIFYKGKGLKPTTCNSQLKSKKLQKQP